MTVTNAEIGPVYDLLLATRDGSTLACKNKVGNIVNISQLAFMTSIDRNQSQHEETELQHKDQLIQLASSNLTDREFNQWPQVSQGDWSGGLGQRVLTGGTPITSFGPQSDPSRYWTGTGLLWPVWDYLPQQPVALTPKSIAIGGDNVVAAQLGPASGTSTYQWAIVGTDTTTTKVIIWTSSGDTMTANDVSATVPFAEVFRDLFGAFNWTWLVTQTSIYNLLGPTANAKLASLPAGANVVQSGCAAGQVGSQSYIAVPFTSATGTGGFVRVYNVTNVAGGAPLGNSSTDYSFDTNVNPIRCEFSGGLLYVLLGGGDRLTLVSIAIAGGSGTITTVTTFKSSAVGEIVEVAGTLFVLIVPASGGAILNTLILPEMYLVQGNSVQDIGQLVPTVDITPTTFIRSLLRPVAFGPYAIFALDLTPDGITSFFQVYGYDVQRGRLFKMGQNTNVVSRGLGSGGIRLGLMTAAAETYQGSSRFVQWGVAFNNQINSTGLGPDLTHPIQELGMNIASSSGFTLNPLPPVQSAFQVVSSLIDFTNAQNKLFRQLLAIFTPFPSDGTITVQLDAWLDQDPNNLSSVPTFTTGAVGSGVNGGVTGQTHLALLINKIARKLVYRTTTVGPAASSAFTPAVKLQEVIIQAATGWARTMTLLLADRVKTNSPEPADCWQQQQVPGQPVMDGTVAYNFLRQLWRLKGGEVIANFPNQDPSANWLLQDMHFDSPKPFSSRSRADLPPGLEYICQVKMREDI